MRSNRTEGFGLRGWGLVLIVVVACLARPNAQKYTFDQVVAGLTHPDARTRLRAIELLKEADYPEAVVPIAERFGDADDRVQLAAIDAERSLFTTRPVVRRRRMAFIIEVRSGTQTGESRLALKSRDVPPQVLSGLTIALRDANPTVRAAAIDLTALLAPEVCGRLAGEMCNRLGNALIENINTRRAQLRRGAMSALGRLQYPNAVQALSDQLSYYEQGPDAIAALEGLAGIGHPTSISIFQRTLTNSNADMRRLAVEGIARAGDREVVAELHRATQGEGSYAVLLALHYANAKLGVSEDGIDQMVAALDDNALRPHAVYYLLDLAESVAPALVEALRNDNPDRRHIVAEILGFSGDPRVVSALQTATKDSDSDVALAAQRAIDRINLQ
jgi:HEAT repeat protein